MPNRIITKSSPILIKKITSALPTNLFNKLTELNDINDSGLSETNAYLKYDSASEKFKFVSLTSLGVNSINSLSGDVTIAGAGTVSVSEAGSTITITGTGGAGGGLDSAAVSSLIDSALNVLDTHDSAAVEGQIDSAYVRPLARAAITAGSNITYDSATGTISSTASGTVDSAAVNTLIAAADTHDSALVQGQIDSNLNALDTHDSAAVLGQINAKFANDAAFSKDLNVDSNLTVGGYIGGPAVFTIDPAAIGDSTGKVIILGDLQVDGTQTTINSTTVSISDKNIVLADSAANASQADGAGITVNGASATIQYASTGDKWVFNKAPYYNTNRLLTAADTLDADTLGGNDSSYYLNYNNFTNTPTIPTVDSATIRPLARAALVAGSNITYDSATGVIASTAAGGTDSASVVSIADSRIGVASIGDLSDVDLTGVATDRVLKWDGSKFVTAVDATGSGGAGIALTDLSANDAGGFGSFAYNDVSGVFTYTGADSADVKTVTNIPYSNLTGTPTIPTVDSATIRPLARAAIVAGTNITYDSATGVISSTDTGIDSTAVNTLIAAADTHDSAAVLGQINTKFANDATFSKDLNVDSNLTVGGYIGGPAVFTIDPAAIGDSTGKVVILGDLQVDGLTTTINSTTVSISDKNIILADSAADSSQANGAGITVNGANAKLTYTSADDRWTFNKAPYYNTNRLLTAADDLHDSALVQGQIDSNFTNDTTFVRVAGDDVSGPITFLDNVEARFGAGGTEPYDFRVYSTGSSNRIQAGETDTLTVAAGTVFFATKAFESTLTINSTSSTDLYYNKVKVAETTSTGMSMNRLAADSSVTVGGNAVLTTASTIDADTFGGEGNTSDTFLRSNQSDSMAGSLTIDSDLTVLGDATISGSLTVSNNSEVRFTDNIITFNYGFAGSPSDNVGFEVVRGSQPTVSFIWNETDDQWDFGTQNVNTTGKMLFSNEYADLAALYAVDAQTYRGMVAHVASTGKEYIANGDSANDWHALLDEVSSNTDDLSEGTSNLYYTQSRVDSAIDARVTTEFVDTLTGGSFLRNDSDETMSASLTITGDLTAQGTITTGSGSNTTVVDATASNQYSIVHNLQGVSVTTGNPTTISEYAHGGNAASIEYVMHLHDATAAETQVTKVLATFDGTNLQFTEYGQIHTGDSDLGTFTVSDDGSNIDLNFTRRGSNNVTVKIAKTIIA